MKRDPKVLAVMIAFVALIMGVMDLVARDLLRGATSLSLAAIWGLVAVDVPERSTAGSWLVSGLLAVAFLLVGIRYFAL